MATHYEPIFVKNIRSDGSIQSLHHNMRDGKDPKDTSLFQVGYVHKDNVQENHFMEVRIDDFGDKRKGGVKGFIKEKLESVPMCIGIGVGCPGPDFDPASPKPEAFKYGIMADVNGNVLIRHGDEIKCLTPVRSLVRGDVIHIKKGNIMGVKGNIHVIHEECLLHSFETSTGEEHSFFVGMNNKFERVTLLRNKLFSEEHKANPDHFNGNMMRVLVSSMNEGSPRYGEGVARGGQHLLSDGMLVRRLSEMDIKIVNYSAGAGSNFYDAKYGASYGLPDFLPEGLRRNRSHFAGNELTIRCHGNDEYYVCLKSVLTGQEQSFHGTAAEWNEERNDLLNHGEKYLINLPAQNGSLQTNDLLIAGTKCKTVANVVAASLAWRVVEAEKDIPSVLLLGGDRSQTIGSITGAVTAYEDICILFFDAHFDMRDPNASSYPMVHGSPLFFLLNEQLREAARAWEAQTETMKSRDPKIRDAIEFLKSTPEGSHYYDSLLNDTSSGYRGFNWLQTAKKVNAKRIAFVGNRAAEWETGSSLGGPLPNLFKNLLDLDEQIHTSTKVRQQGVTAVFKEIVEQWRGTFDKKYVEEKDAAARERGETKWIPPIYVSWDTDSIDPPALPCTIAQEANGLSSEECLAFCDEVADTRSMVMMETCEFNPDLWEGYLNEPIQLTMNDFLAGAYANDLRQPLDKSSQRLDLQGSTKLLQDMIVRISRPYNNKLNAVYP